MAIGVQLVDHRPVQMYVEQGTIVREAISTIAALVNTRHRRLWVLTRSVLFALQASIIQRQVNRQILALLVEMANGV